MDSWTAGAANPKVSHGAGGRGGGVDWMTDGGRRGGGGGGNGLSAGKTWVGDWDARLRRCQGNLNWDRCRGRFC